MRKLTKALAAVLLLAVMVSAFALFSVFAEDAAAKAAAKAAEECAKEKARLEHEESLLVEIRDLLREIKKG